MKNFGALMRKFSLLKKIGFFFWLLMMILCVIAGTVNIGIRTVIISIAINIIYDDIKELIALLKEVSNKAAKEEKKKRQRQSRKPRASRRKRRR